MPNFCQTKTTKARVSFTVSTQRTILAIQCLPCSLPIPLPFPIHLHLIMSIFMRHSKTISSSWGKGVMVTISDKGKEQGTDR